ncbi:MAG: hypothetical protein FWF86_02965 [Clostridia bacterium]|nr:hypothetical protein [Clostridia bacterium]
MKQTLGWVVIRPAGPECAPAAGGFATPLLGRTCREHVRQALADSGARVADDERAFEEPFDVVLLAREDAPCLEPAALAALAAAAGGGTAESLTSPRGEAVAVAVSSGEWLRAVKSCAMSAIEAAGMLLSARDDSRPAAYAPGGGETVADATGYAAAFRVLRERIARRHIAAGVILPDPERVIIEAEVTIGPGAVIYPDNLLMGRTSVGAGCTLYPGNRLENAVVGQGCAVEHSVLLDCDIGDETSVGPFAYLRPGTVVGSRCRVGDFVEIKNSRVGDHSKISHLTYVGDGELGRNVNLGCGVVFVNYDGKAKRRCVVEDNAFVGCNCNLVAPVTVGRDAYVAAGGTVVEDVPPGSLYVARARGEVKEGWVTRRKEKGML